MARTGRPPKLDDQVPGRNGQTVSQTICARVEATGCAPTLCAGELLELGVTREIIRAWLKEGRRVADEYAKGARPHDFTWNQRRYHDFLCATSAAQGRYEQGLLALHAQLERGGSFTRDPQTGEIEPHGLFSETITTKTTPDGVETTRKIEVKMPDRHAIEWALERKGSENYRPRVEVTGADGAPLIPEGDDDDARQLASLEAALEAYERGHRAGAEDERSRTTTNQEAP